MLTPLTFSALLQFAFRSYTKPYFNYVVSWRLEQTLDIEFVLEATKDALQTAKPEIWNGDYGTCEKVRSRFITAHI